MLVPIVFLKIILHIFAVIIIKKIKRTIANTDIISPLESICTITNYEPKMRIIAKNTISKTPRMIPVIAIFFLEDLRPLAPVTMATTANMKAGKTVRIVIHDKIEQTNEMIAK